MEPGQKIAVLLGSANRDPAVFEEPDEFRVDRDPNNHVAFGVGVHFCLGAPLARMELAESTTALFETFPRLELAADPEPRGTFVLRGYRRVLLDATRHDSTTKEGTTMGQHDAVEVIIAKRERAELSDSQIDWVIDAYTRGEVADEQMSSLAMAILLNGMNRREISRWTTAMIRSGERMDFSGLSRPTSDKHSTGGVGDKITLPLAPLVAACGVAVPQLSGPRAGAHRRHAGQAGVHPGLAGGPVATRR